MSQIFSAVATILPANGQGIPLHGWPDGWLSSLQSVVDEYVRPGGTGSGMQIIGTRSPKKRVPVWFASDTFTDVRDTAKNLEALVGTVVQVFDSFNRSFTRVKVTGVTIDKLVACGGAAANRVEATLDLEPLVNGS